jgi:FAD/FMN-containing dehydrogenase/Fe-S oxidoreductase
MQRSRDVQVPFVHSKGVQSDSEHAHAIDAQALAAELRAKIRGEVRFDDGSRALYATDGSIYRQVPVGVVIPRDADDVVMTVALCRRYHAPVLPRGCGTSLKGQCCNVAVVLDMSKYMNQIVSLDAHNKRARVQPGLICDHLRAAAERYHLTFGPDPATHGHCTLGGMIGNNSCGAHSVMAGKMVDNLEEMEILTYDGLRMRVGATSEDDLERIIAAGGRRGEIYAGLKWLRDSYAHLIRARYPQIPRNVSGYGLDWLLPEHGFHVARALVGTEGTCVTVLEATTVLVDSPPARTLLVLGYADAYHAADHVPEIMSYRPLAVEGFDDVLIEDLRKKGRYLGHIAHLPEGGGWLLVEFGGATKEQANEQARRLMDALRHVAEIPHMKLVEDAKEAAMLWEIRESAVGASSVISGEQLTWPGWEDTAVAPEKLGNYLRDFRALVERYGYRGAYYGHFGQGCVHMNISFDMHTADGIKHFHDFMEEGSELVIRYGGSLSGEHGDGQVNGEFLHKMYGPELVQAFREFKALWDPDWKMNPGKVVDAYRPDQNLRLGTTYHPPELHTRFHYQDDLGSFARATLRCIGIGRCRRTEQGTMCPSFMVTREEKHSTRGRAHLLFEMLQGDPVGGWRDDSVKEALDLCLSCKGCKGDCPVNVDIATYKAEFLSHYYQRRLRPRNAYAFGLIYWWARLASHMPRLVNAVTHVPLLSNLAKFAAGMAMEREIPTFAPQTFSAWFRQRGERNVDCPPVLLWPDTFNNYFHPETAQAAVEVLENVGYRVVLPPRSLCCGRPLYDYGMLMLARYLLKQILTTLRPQIQEGLPVVVLEPSCAAVFRDELLNLLPHDEDAKRLSQQTFLLSEFLRKKAVDCRLPKMKRKAIVHGHCHHKAIMTMKDEDAVLQRLGLDYTMLDSGCCGMAGAFGFEAGEHYEVAMKCGERVLLPAVRAAEKDSLIIADGFSCREQIAQASDRHALHLAQVIQLAMRGVSQTEVYPEQTSEIISKAKPTPGKVLVGIGALIVGLVLAWNGSRYRRAGRVL